MDCIKQLAAPVGLVDRGRCVAGHAARAAARVSVLVFVAVWVVWAVGWLTPAYAGPAPASPPAHSAEHASTQRLIAEFTPWVGSRDETRDLVLALRTGRASAETGPASLAPVTGPLGYGEVRLALKMAQGVLQQQGVPYPSPDQLRVALHGGGLNTAQGEVVVPGVLTQKMLGSSWATLARAYGVSVQDVLPPKRAPQRVAAQASPAKRSAVADKTAQARKEHKVKKAAKAQTTPTAQAQGIQ